MESPIEVRSSSIFFLMVQQGIQFIEFCLFFVGGYIATYKVTIYREKEFNDSSLYACKNIMNIS